LRMRFTSSFTECCCNERSITVSIGVLRRSFVSSDYAAD
jgi:hypothetical protein